MSSGPLSGVFVIDLTIWGLGPLATVALADLGADVVKIEDPNGGDPSRNYLVPLGDVEGAFEDGRSSFFEAFNRGKRGVTLDLKTDKGKAIFHELLATADVLVENLRPGVAAKLGVDYSSLSAINPGLVYASANGYGPHGVESMRPAFDYIGQARSGYMLSIGEKGSAPAHHQIGTADISGAMMLTQAILTGLASRGLTGKGSHVATSHLGAMLWLQSMGLAGTVFINVDEYPRTGRKDVTNPLCTTYECSDGKWIVLGLLQSDRYWGDFCEAVDRLDLAEDPRLGSHELRREHARELIDELDKVFVKRTRAEWLEILGRYEDFVFERVQTPGELSTDPQIAANDYLIPLDYGPLGQRKVVRFPVHVNGEAVQNTRLAPGYGAHTWEVLRERLNYSDQQLEALALQDVIR